MAVDSFIGSPFRLPRTGGVGSQEGRFSASPVAPQALDGTVGTICAVVNIITWEPSGTTRFHGTGRMLAKQRVDWIPACRGYVHVAASKSASFHLENINFISPANESYFEHCSGWIY